MIDYNKHRARLIYAGKYFLAFHFDKDYLYGERKFISYNGGFSDSLHSRSINTEEHIMLLSLQNALHRVQYNKKEGTILVDSSIYVLHNPIGTKILDTVSGIKSLTIRNILERLDNMCVINNRIFRYSDGNIMHCLFPMSSFTNKYSDNFIMVKLFNLFEKYGESDALSYKVTWFAQDVIDLLSAYLGNRYYPSIFTSGQRGISYSLMAEFGELFYHYEHVYFYEAYAQGTLDIREIRKYVKDLSNTVLDVDFSIHSNLDSSKVADRELSDKDFAEGFDSVFTQQYAKLLLFNHLEVERHSDFLNVEAADVLVSRFGTSINKNFMGAFLYFLWRVIDRNCSLVGRGNSLYAESTIAFYWLLGIFDATGEEFYTNCHDVFIRRDKFKELMPYFKYAFSCALLSGKFVHSSYDIVSKSMKVKLSDNGGLVEFSYFVREESNGN